MSIQNLILATKAYIMQMYLNEEDTRPWALAYSGGKDSTAAGGLVTSVIESLPKEKRTRWIYFVMSNTTMENPLVDAHMREQMRLINDYARKHDLPISVHMVERDLKNSYFVKTLGLGYFLPQNNGKGRWCTDRLKIKPQDKFLKNLNPSYILTGVRKSESRSRQASIEKWSISEFIGNHVSLKDRHTFNPIVHWTIEDVWKFLEYEGLSWGSTLSVRTIYKDATGECGFTNPAETEKKSVEVCGARHGCWNCPVILKDKSTEKMSEKHQWMEPLTYWRSLQLKVYGSYKPDAIEGENRKSRSEKLASWREINAHNVKTTKSGYMRSGKKLEDGQGCLTVIARRFLLNELLETEKMVNRLRKYEGLEPLKLISDEEIELIKQHWYDDLADRPFLKGKELDLKGID